MEDREQNTWKKVAGKEKASLKEEELQTSVHFSRLTKCVSASSLQMHITNACIKVELLMRMVVYLLTLVTVTVICAELRLQWHQLCICPPNGHRNNISR